MDPKTPKARSTTGSRGKAADVRYEHEDIDGDTPRPRRQIETPNDLSRKEGINERDSSLRVDLNYEIQRLSGVTQEAKTTESADAVDEDSDDYIDKVTVRKPGVTVSSPDYDGRYPIAPAADVWAQRSYKNLDDLLRRTYMPCTPATYASGRLVSTKATTDGELSVPGEQQLKTIVVCRNLLASLEDEGKKMLANIKVESDDLSDMLYAARYVPRRDHPMLSKRIFSESDVVAWCESTMFHPAAECINACNDAEVPPAAKGSTGKINVSCVPSQSVNADKVFWSETKDVEKEVDGKPETLEFPSTLCTVEIKSPNIITPVYFPSFFSIEDRSCPDVIPYRYAWTTSHSNPLLRKGDKVIMQHFTQGVFEKCNFGILTCHRYTFFTIRDKQTLYVSRPYKPEEHPQFWTFCFAMLACGKLKLDLPTFDTTKWPWWAQPDKHVVRLNGNLQARPIVGTVIETTWRSLTGRSKYRLRSSSSRAEPAYSGSDADEALDYDSSDSEILDD
ncbi:hypothetical protein FKP32DRAFT_1678686 [Trametes sanguinea]|nr:hypothetical protein FKP32DRAFT_1678686 [Trametes sanguinea]